MQKYPKLGIYAYLIKAGKKVMLFDTGPKHNTLLGFKKGPTPNTSFILAALDHCFP